MNIFFVNGFLNLLQQFLDQLKLLLPVWDDILAVQKTIELSEWSLASKQAVVEQFMYYVYPFYKHILLRKEVFFMKSENISESETFRSVDEATQNTNYTKMFQLKDLWQQFSVHNKTAIWDFFGALTINGSKASTTEAHQEFMKHCTQEFSSKPPIKSELQTKPK